MRRYHPMLAVLAVPVVAAPAAAQETKGLVRLSLDGSLLDYRSTTVKVEYVDGATGTTVNADEQVATTTVGLLGGGFGVGLGYAPGRSTLFGVRGMLARETTDLGDFGKQTSSTIGAVPYFEYLFSPGHVWRPYVGAEAGFQSTLDQAEAETVGGSTAGIFGASGGVHAFAAPGFSVAAGLGVYGVAGQTNVAAGIDGSVSGIAVIGRVSLSGWLGKVRTAAEARGTTATGAPEPEGASATPSEAAPPAGEAETPIDRGVVKVTTPLAHSTELTVQMTPLSSPEDVAIVLVVRGGDSALGACDELTLQIGAEPHAARGVQTTHHGGGFSASDRISGTMALSALEAAVTTHDPVRVEACGSSWEIREPQLRQLKPAVTTTMRVIDGSRLPKQLPTVEERGEQIALSTPLSLDATLSVDGRPATLGDSMGVTLTFRSTERKLAGCKTLVVELPELRFEVQGVKYQGAPSGSRWVESLTGTARTLDVVALAESRGEPRMVACGEQVRVALDQQRALYSFVEVFARRAIDAKAWPAPAPVEPPAPEAGTASSKSPPPAKGGPGPAKGAPPPAPTKPR